jgi:hypothetical protein
VRATPSALGLLQGARAGCAAAAAACSGAAWAGAAGAGDAVAGAVAAAAGFGGAPCDHATPGAHSETAKINPAATRIVFPLD